jgi:hypothetical protein
MFGVGVERNGRLRLHDAFDLLRSSADYIVLNWGPADHVRSTTKDLTGPQRSQRYP